MFPLQDPGLLTALLAPPALAMLARHRALHGPDEMEARWFTFARRAGLLAVLSPVVWILVAMRAVGGDSVLRAWLVGLRGPEIVAAFLLIFVPIALLPAVLGLIVHDVARRLGTTDFDDREVLERAAWLTGAAVVPSVLAALATLALVQRELFLATCLFVVAAALALFGLARSRRGLELTPHAITCGALRDRLFAIGAGAGVKLQQLYVLPMKRLRMANAFAVHGRAVMVTDLLLERLTTDEVDAVMAHEIAHLRRGDPLRLFFARLACLVAPMAAWWSLGWPAGSLALTLGVLASSAMSRRIERATDREALKIGAKAEALISGLAKLARFSHVPLSWSRWTGWFLTHPSVEERARDLAAAAGLPESTTRALLAGNATGAHYEVPRGLESGGRVFSTPFKQRVLSWNLFQMLLVAALVPAAIFAQARLHLDTGALRLPLTLLALVLTPLVSIALANFAAVQPLIGIRRRLAERLGLADSRGWILAGLSPHADVRIYEGFSNWELGFVRVGAEGLEFASEETRFALAARDLEKVELAEGPPAWVRSKTVRVWWRDGAGAVRPLRVTPLDVAGIHAVTAAAGRLADAIETWRSEAVAVGQAAHAPLAALPPTGEVTSTDPRAIGRPVMLVPFFAFDLFFAVTLGMLFRLPPVPMAGPGWLDVALIALATHVVLLVPYWRARGETPAPAEETIENERAA